VNSEWHAPGDNGFGREDPAERWITCMAYLLLEYFDHQYNFWQNEQNKKNASRLEAIFYR
jgi:hypothetical protein